MQQQRSVAFPTPFNRVSRVGYWYCDQFQFAKDAAGQRLDFAPMPWFQLIGLVSLLAVMLGLFCAVAMELDTDPNPLGVIILGLCVISAPLFLPIVRRFASRKSRPFLFIGANSATICLFGGRREVAVDDIKAVVDASFSDDEGSSVSELQLFIICGQGIESVCLASMLGGAEKGLRQLAREISDTLKCPHITYDDRVKKGEPADTRESPSQFY